MAALGEGNFGTVARYRLAAPGARQLQVEVAIKTMAGIFGDGGGAEGEEEGEGAEQAKRTLRELTLLRHTRHP